MATPSPAAASSRSARLSKFFTQILMGKQTVQDGNQAKLFLEAICDQDDHTSCVEKLIANITALDALRKSVRFDLSPSFINAQASHFLQYIAEPQVKQLCNGQFLRQIVGILVEPPTFWNSLIVAHQNGSLDPHNTKYFAWLLYELLHLPGNDADPYRAVAQAVTEDESLTKSASLETRTLGQKIKHFIQHFSGSASQEKGWGAGGRHDNDHVNFRQICIIPTPDELICPERAFYRRADVLLEAEPEQRVGIHLDNQFRLLREDMLGEFRNDLQIIRGRKNGRRSGYDLKGLIFADVKCGNAPGSRKLKPCTIALRCTNGLSQFQGLNDGMKKSFLKENRNFVKHQSLGCLLDGDELVAFATIDRDEELLIQDPPLICLLISSEAAFKKALLVAKMSKSLHFIQVNTPLFAFEPVLKQLQSCPDLQLAEELLFLDSPFIPRESEIKLEKLIKEIKKVPDGDVGLLLAGYKKIKLDESQLASLISGLSLRVSLIQGPPGTGKSFTGAALVKFIYAATKETILVICYTNHALDQFLEDLLDMGIPADNMLRLGSKSTLRTKPLGLHEQKTNYKNNTLSWSIIEGLEAEARMLKAKLSELSARYRNRGFDRDQLLEYLEFSGSDSHFFAALSTPEEHNGMTRVGKRGKAIGKYYLLDRWAEGSDAGIFCKDVTASSSKVWQLDKSTRVNYIMKWETELLEEHTTTINELAQEYDVCQQKVNELLNQRNIAIIKSKRIIGCTTTAASMYANELQAAAPGVILVEEAGEILESHVIAAMGPGTKQLIMIGDHKQLRPKVNTYELTVEKGHGYDLNCSMFERLVKGGLPHTTLLTQHRMRPEISSIVRKLTYPDLLDAPGTLNRPDLRGFADNVIFFDHRNLELDNSQLTDRRDEGSKSSKQNIFEADMVLSCVRYLAQQGYGTDDIVILTPYLGQLKLLVDKLSRDHDPVLNDLDSYDLVQAGLMPAATAHLSRRRIKISTIDNFQGEESAIVVASLTRSNENGDIGFLRAPERLNVLVSRARNALIIIGNSATFLKARNGKETWGMFFDQLKIGKHIYDGFPVKCERHSEKRTILRRKEDFDVQCPDGGCSDPCGAKLSCGIHECPSRCHQLVDHSKMECNRIIKDNCPQNHKMSWKCHRQRPKICPKCEKEAEDRLEKLRRDHDLELKREEKQRRYAQELASIRDAIASEQQKLKDEADERVRQSVLRQHKDQLERVTAAVSRVHHTPPSGQPQSSEALSASKNTPIVQEAVTLVPSLNEQHTGIDKSSRNSEDGGIIPASTSSAKDDWEYQKTFNNANNAALDSLMSMIGLETIKNQFLSIKARVDTVVRQNASLKDERFGAALLGNPGTGKTTVARLYADFLTSMGVLPGNHFVETTGSRLASAGVSGCQKHLEDIQNNGGGALFIDEAYQLVAGHGGSQVLDFLLREIEELTGKVVFILAGYNKQMESFFAHNPGYPSRIPIQMQFSDYEDAELLRILAHQIEKKYGGAMKVEGDIGGLFSRIVARRIGRGRGREGFGNARAVQNVFTQIAARQAERLTRERRAGQIPDDYLITKVDMLGPEPSSALANNSAWKKLQDLIGLRSVKQSVQILLDRIKTNYDRELEEKPLIECSLNRVFLGSPGTGKTSVAKLYGHILADLGLLSNGEVVMKNPADFVGSALGQSESNTKAILAATVGKVLIIDEAYMLAGGSNESGAQTDSYKTAVIDTIVAEVQSTATEDRCILLLGYSDQMEEMFQQVNPGLSRRFPIDSAFVFEDFTDDELDKILKLKLKEQGFTSTDQARHVALEVLRRARNRPHFGNAGEVDILLDKAKGRHQIRLSSFITKNPDSLDAHDFDEDFDRGARAATNCRKLFEGVVGCEDLVLQLEGYQHIAESMKQRGLDPRDQIPFNFLFRGPPGTGKTTTARRMGKIYYDMGFLAGAQVVECSATELIGQYVGQTGPKTQKMLQKALGKILFIDEAYRLAEGHFAKEAMDEIVDSLTKPAFFQKLIVILAGYDADINRLMLINPGLTSRFPDTVVFHSLQPDQCLELLRQELTRKSIDTSILKKSPANFQQQICDCFRELSSLPSWGNARDIQSLAKNMRGFILKAAKDPASPLVLSEDVTVTSIKSMIAERSHRAESSEPLLNFVNAKELHQHQFKTAQDQPTSLRTEIHTKVDTSNEISLLEPKVEGPIEFQESRDIGVSDEVWKRLEQDKRAAEALEQQQQNALNVEIALQEALKIAKSKEEQVPQPPVDDHARREQEAARIRLAQYRRGVEAELLRQMEAAEKARQEREREVKAQQKLRSMGVCVAGFRWIKQSGGYRCAGGSHFIGDKELGLEN